MQEYLVWVSESYIATLHETFQMLWWIPVLLVHIVTLKSIKDNSKGFLGKIFLTGALFLCDIYIYIYIYWNNGAHSFSILDKSRRESRS